MAVEKTLLLKLLSPDEAFELLDEHAGLFGDNGGDPDGDLWLQEVDNFTPEQVSTLIGKGLAEVVEGWRVDYEYLLEKDYDNWCGYQINFTAYFLDRAEACRFNADQEEEKYRARQEYPQFALRVYARTTCGHDPHSGTLWETARTEHLGYCFGGDTVQSALDQAVGVLRPYFIELHGDHVVLYCVETEEGTPASERDEEEWGEERKRLYSVRYCAELLVYRTECITVHTECITEQDLRHIEVPVITAGGK